MQSNYILVNRGEDRETGKYEQEHLEYIYKAVSPGLSFDRRMHQIYCKVANNHGGYAYDIYDGAFSALFSGWETCGRFIIRPKMAYFKYRLAEYNNYDVNKFVFFYVKDVEQIFSRFFIARARTTH